MERWDCWGGFWALLIIYSVCLNLEMITFTYQVSAIQSVEREFQIPSKASGALMSAQKLGYIPMVLILSYFGSRGNRARWIGLGCLAIAFACLLISSPHLIFPIHPTTFNDSVMTQVAEKAALQFPAAAVDLSLDFARLSKEAIYPVGYCNPIVNKMKAKLEDVKCAEKQTNDAAYYIVLVGMLILGLGHTVPWVVGLPLIDDNVKRKNAPVFFGTLRFIKILGPMWGFLIGGACIGLYYTLKTPEGLTTRDPRWIGAWWLGFLIVSVLLTPPSLLLAFYPSKHPQDQEISIVKANNRAQNERRRRRSSRKMSAALVEKTLEDNPSETGVLATLKDFIPSIIQIVKSKVYLCILLGSLVDNFAFSGYWSFLPKYLLNHYGLSQSTATYALAVGDVISYALGNWVGSLMIKKWKLEGRKAAMFVAISSGCALLLHFPRLILSCHSTVNSVGRLASQTGFNLTLPCNSDCFCDPVQLNPVCSRSGTPYFSPCHAGCRNATITAGKAVFSNCFCVDDGENASTEWCRDDCTPPVITFLVLQSIGAFIAGCGRVAAILLILRSVPEKDRSLALGFRGFICALIGRLPSPMVYGAIIDRSCLLWNQNCGRTGSCTIYEPSSLRIKLNWLNGGVRIVGILFDILVWYFAKNIRILEDPGPTKPNPEL